MSNPEKLIDDCTNISQLIGSYNFHKFMMEENPLSRANIPWHTKCFDLTVEKLERNGVNTKHDNFFDSTIFEHYTAPGLKILKKTDHTFEIIEDPYNLENDLKNSEKIKELVKHDVFAQKLYSSLCNIQWYKGNLSWGCSWRYAGEVVAGLRDKGECYMDFYCSGNEGTLSKEVAKELLELSWTVVPPNPSLI